MALIKCAECNHEVSDKAASCPKCGAPVADAVPEPSPLESHDGIQCPFCKKYLDASAVTCGYCGAEYGYYNQTSGQVTSVLKLNLVTSMLAGECILAFVLLMIGNSVRFTHRQAFFWIVLVAVVVGLVALATLKGLLVMLHMKSRGKDWWKTR